MLLFCVIQEVAFVFVVVSLSLHELKEPERH